MMLNRWVLVVAFTATITLAAPSSGQACGGDCDGSCDVTVDEILTMVNGALGLSPVENCLAGDTNSDGAITVDEILAGVTHALEGCTGPPCRSPETRCAVPAGTGVNVGLQDCQFLSSYRFFVAPAAQQRPNEGVIPYDLNTALFSDFTEKHRFVWLPPGTQAQYEERRPFEFPVGSVIIKTFAYPNDQTDGDAGEDILETRLLIHRANGWVGLPYVWNAERSDAELRLVGATLQVSGVQADGEFGSFPYFVPNANQCKACHRAFEEKMAPIGPNARNLNKDFAYADGSANQLVRWTELGILAGAPTDPESAPRAAAFDDPTSGSIELRARAYLDVNCAHCHNETGPARPSGLWLEYDQTNPTSIGVCKQPVAAGKGTGGFSHAIDPGSPDTSILTFRMASTETDIMMPELGRTRVDTEGLEVVRAWIAEMEGECVLE